MRCLPLLLAASFSLPTFADSQDDSRRHTPSHHPHSVERVEITLPAGLHQPNDVGDAADPRGLPRLTDYVISSIESHTVLGNNLFDLFSSKKESVLGKVVEREYKLDRYAKRASATTENILRHYRDHIELINGKFESETPTQLKANITLSGTPISVTIEVRDGGKRYLVTLGGLGALDGTTTTIRNEDKRDSHPHGDDAHHDQDNEKKDEHHSTTPHPITPPTAQPDQPSSPKIDSNPFSTSSFRMPSEATLWPSRGTRGMTVLLVGPGVHRVTAVRFDSTNAEIIARENARVRVRVPMLPTGNVAVTLVEENGNEQVKKLFQVLDSPRIDAAFVTIAPCDSRPEKYGSGISEIQPHSARPGQIIKLMGRRLDDVTHLTFTVAQHEVDPRNTGVHPDLIGIDFGASGKARTAPRYLDTLSANIGSSYGAKPSTPGECDVHNLSGYAAVKHVADGEMIVCVPPLALSGPIGVWRPDGPTGDACATTDISLQVNRTATPRRE